MGGKYQAYPEYRDSGVEWLDRIPEKWMASYLGFECSVKARLGWKGLKADEYVDEGLIFLATPNIKGKTIDFSNVNYITQERYDESPEIMLESGDVLVTKDGSTTGTTNLVRELPAPATVNSSIAILRSFGTVDSLYLLYFFSSDYTQHVINRMRGGMGVPHLFQADLRKFNILIPPKFEQTKIAHFLDHETAKIDTLIEKQQQLIKLLKEKRQAVISHAVTKGLNPNAPMRDSGVEWLGEIPEHWATAKIKHIAELTPRKTEIIRKKYLKCSFVPMEKLKTDSLILDEVCLIGDVYDGYTYFKDDDILMAKVTPCFENKNIAIAKGLKGGIGFGSSEIYVLRVNNNVSNNFLYYRLQEDGFMKIATAAMTGAGGLKRVPSEVVNNFAVALPPENEQVMIESYLRDFLAKVDALVVNANRAIGLLKERRTALISAAVTGKIDVRDWQNPSETNTAKEDAA